jgi:hypothetical protein
LLVLPGAIAARFGGLTWPAAVAVGPPVTYGVVALAIVPLGAVGIPWNGWTGLITLVLVVGAVLGFRRMLSRHREPAAESLAVGWGPGLAVAAGVLLGATLIGWAAVSGIPQWQSIPSTWDSVWHANTIRFILDTGQASPTHMGELRNVETHDVLYYPSTFHAQAALLSQLTGAAATTAYTVTSLAASIWLFPVSAAVLTWKLLRERVSEWRTAAAAATAAAMSASFTAIPYVEFDTASMPNLAAYGVAIPATALITSTLRHRDRIPLAILAVLGVFSVHTTGGIVTALFVAAWWLFEGLWRPVRGRVADFVTLVLVAAPSLMLLLPQFVVLIRLTDIIEGHQFPTHQGRKRALLDALVQHTRHLNDFPIQWTLIALAAVGGLVILVRRIWWPLAVWALLVVSIVYSSAQFGTPLGLLVAKFSSLFYNDPRRLSAVVTMLLAAAAGVGAFTLVEAAVRGGRAVVPRVNTRVWQAAGVAVIVAVSVASAWQYLPRNRLLFGQKYDTVMVDQKDLAAFSYLSSLPGAHDTLIGNANTDGTAWMYAVAGLRPLWTHYDYPVQQGPGYQRFIFWAFADDADSDHRIADAVHALNIRYVLTSSTVVRQFVMPDGLVSLGESESWAKIYDNGRARIYEWRGDQQRVTR